jgi:nucleoside-diphosphate-sugar epimerase
MQALVTGANGFVGRALCSDLISRGVAVNRCVRSAAITGDTFSVGEVDGETDWSAPLKDCDVVVHLAGRAHQLNDWSRDPLEEFRRINVRGSLALFSQAVVQGIKRFVYISSVGVNGNQTTIPFMESDLPQPFEPYAISKLEAEVGLKKIATETGVELVIIRPPLVYGPGAPGNFGRLVRCVRKGIPLPLGAIHNQRSLVALGNLTDFIAVCLKNPAAANQIFLVSDGKDISTTELLKRISLLMQKPDLLLPVPSAWIEKLGIIMGQGDTVRRLCHDLQVDISKARNLLEWSPPLTLDEGLLLAINGM